MIGFFVWLLFGTSIGWLVSIVMQTGDQHNALFNMSVGIIGAFLGGIIFSLIPGSGVDINEGSFSLWSLFVSFLGAVALLGFANWATRGRIR